MATVDITAPVQRPPEMSGNPVRRVVADSDAVYRLMRALGSG